MKMVAIEDYIKKIAEDELWYKNRSDFTKGLRPEQSKNMTFQKFILVVNLILHSMFDFAELYLKVNFGGKLFKSKNIVYTTEYFCAWVDGKLTDRVLKPLHLENVIYINTSREKLLSTIDNQKVYNIGGLARLLSIFYLDKSGLMRGFLGFTLINNLIIKKLNHNCVFMMMFYNVNGFSLVFSKYRKNITLIEVQHGSVVNYPPYIIPSPVKIADVFYVKNETSIDYLKTHLCLNYPAEYQLLPHHIRKNKYSPGLHILYASTVEFNGIHPVMKEFLKKICRTDLDLIVRLHPREKDKQPLFEEQLGQYNIKYRFDHSSNWLDSNTIENLIVITPWSSCLEDAYDNGYFSIIIDPVGRDRYEYLLDNKRCFYSENLLETVEKLMAKYS